jgi:hypothetical protein
MSKTLFLQFRAEVRVSAVSATRHVSAAAGANAGTPTVHDLPPAANGIAAFAKGFSSVAAAAVGIWVQNIH